MIDKLFKSVRWLAIIVLLISSIAFTYNVISELLYFRVGFLFTLSYLIAIGSSFIGKKAGYLIALVHAVINFYFQFNTGHSSDVHFSSYTYQVIIAFQIDKGFFFNVLIFTPVIVDQLLIFLFGWKVFSKKKAHN
jgi:hypothetical protein